MSKPIKTPAVRKARKALERYIDDSKEIDVEKLLALVQDVKDAQARARYEQLDMFSTHQDFSAWQRDIRQPSLF